jgi:hypothetical protein
LNTDRLLAWVGVVIGILGLIPIFRDSAVQFQLVYGVTLCVLLVLFVVLYRTGRGPQYETLSIRKTLEIVTADGSFARMRREQRIRVRYGQLSEIWCRNIVADGSIRNLLIDDSPPDDAKTLGCLLSICKRFRAPIFRNQQIDIVWSYELHQAFLAKSERLEHDVTPGTHLLELVVILPKARPSLGASLHELVAGEPAQPLDNPTVGQRSTVLKSTVKRPKEGRTVCLSWEW